jgi:hypothetical protein
MTMVVSGAVRTAGVGHNSKAVHHAYSKHPEVTVPSLDDSRLTLHSQGGSSRRYMDGRTKWRPL